MACRDGFCGGCDRCAPLDEQWIEDRRLQEEERERMDANEHMEIEDTIKDICRRHGVVYLLDVIADVCQRLEAINPGDGWGHAMELIDDAAQTITQLDDREYESDTKVLSG